MKLNAFQNVHLVIKEDHLTCSKYVYNHFVSASKENEHSSFIITGGSTVGGFYELLKDSDEFIWESAQFLLTDERLVPSNSEHSNIGKIKKLINRENFNVIPMNTDGDPKVAKDNFDRYVQSNNLSIDLALVAMGDDGHIASLFPHNSENFESHPFSLLVKNNHEDFSRLSLSYEYLGRSKKIVFLITGAHKSEVLKAILEGDYKPEDYPIQYLLKNNVSKIEIVSDREATSLLNKNILNEFR